MCAEGRIDGAVKKGKMWLIPFGAAKPLDTRFKVNKESKSVLYDIMSDIVSIQGGYYGYVSRHNGR